MLSLVILLLLSLFGSPFSDADVPPMHADAPNRNPAFAPLSLTVTNRSLCIAADDDGPCFSLSDLQVYAPAWKIKPPVWNEYPAALNDVPLASREYTTETVDYLAAHEIRYGDRQSRYLALTFDCEIGPRSTLQILRTLREEGARATFFVQGRYAYRNPEIVRQIVAGEHELGSHSFFHPLFTDLSPVAMTQEITYTEAAIAWAVGRYVPMRYFRFPYARRNRATLTHVASLGYQSSFWDMDPRGWEPNVTAQDVVDYVRQRTHGGGIVIMHCNCWDDANALPGVIQAIRERGLIPGTLSDVLTEKDRNVPGYHLLPP